MTPGPGVLAPADVKGMDAPLERPGCLLPLLWVPAEWGPQRQKDKISSSPTQSPPAPCPGPRNSDQAWACSNPNPLPGWSRVLVGAPLVLLGFPCSSRPFLFFRFLYSSRILPGLLCPGRDDQRHLSRRIPWCPMAQLCSIPRPEYGSPCSITSTWKYLLPS